MKLLFYIMQIIFPFKNKSKVFHLHAMFLQLVKWKILNAHEWRWDFLGPLKI